MKIGKIYFNINIYFNFVLNLIVLLNKLLYFMVFEIIKYQFNFKVQIIYM